MEILLSHTSQWLIFAVTWNTNVDFFFFFELCLEAILRKKKTFNQRWRIQVGRPFPICGTSEESLEYRLEIRVVEIKVAYMYLKRKYTRTCIYSM